MALTSSLASGSLVLLLLATVVKEIASQQTSTDVFAGPPWNYDPNSLNGPDGWSKSYPMCGGQFQSPIDIEVSQVTFDPLLTDFNYINYENTVLSDFELVNTGASIQVRTPDSLIAISGGGLTASYKLAQFHFHWGKDERNGSEHLIDGMASPLEIHLVHWNEKYATFQEALNYSDGVAVLGVFVRVNSSSEHSVLGDLTAYFDAIRYPGNATILHSFALNSLLPEHRSYFRYKGSLTTPACDESVTWSVFHDSIYLNKKQISAFRTTYDFAGKKLLHNFRPPRPLNGRVVYTSRPIPASAIPHQPTVSATTLATLSFVLAIASHNWLS